MAGVHSSASLSVDNLDSFFVWNITFAGLSSSTSVFGLSAPSLFGLSSTPLEPVLTSLSSTSSTSSTSLSSTTL